jgi:hypothetical protein
MEKRNINIKVTSNAKKVMSDMGTESVKQGKKSTGVLAKIKGLTAGIGTGFSAAAGGVRAFATALISSGVGAFVVAAGSLVALLGKAINTSKDFEKALSGLKAITGASSEEMSALADNAKELGRTTAFTASQVVQLQTEFSKLGFSTTEILDATEATLALAAASGTDLADAATVAGNTIRAFGFDASETGRVADVMSKSFTTSALDMEKFRESMKLVAPIAKVTKVSLEESSAALAILADRGVSGSMAGTQLRRVMSDLAGKTGKNFQDSLEITAERLSNASTTAEKLAIAKGLVGDRAKGSLIALAENRDALNDLKIAYENAGGAAQKMADEQLNNLAGDITKLSSAWEGFLLGIEDGEGVLSSIARGAIQMVTKSLTFLTEASEGVADAFRVNFASVKRITSTMAERLGETFRNVGLNITQFAQKAKLTLSEIPLIGQAIDKDALEANMKTTEAALEESNARLQELADKANNESVLRKEHYDKLKADREIKLARKVAEEKKKIVEEEFVEGADTSEDEKLQARLQKEADTRRKFRKKLFEQERSDNAQSDLEKNELARTRHLEELEKIKLEENEKRALIERINKVYDDRANGIREEQRFKQSEIDKLRDEEDVQAKEAAHQKRMMLLQSGLDATARALGEETKMGKLALVVKQGLIMKEMLMEAKKSLSSVTLKAAEAAADTSTGFAKTLSAGFPQNVPLLAAYALQALAIGKSIAGTVGKAKDAARSAGAGGGGSVSMPNLSVPKSAPAFNVVGKTDTNTKALQETIQQSMGDKTIKAYVVAKDVTEQQELDSQIGSNASLG